MNTRRTNYASILALSLVTGLSVSSAIAQQRPTSLPIRIEGTITALQPDINQKASLGGEVGSADLSEVRVVKPIAKKKPAPRKSIVAKAPIAPAEASATRLVSGTPASESAITPAVVSSSNVSDAASIKPVSASNETKTVSLERATELPTKTEAQKYEERMLTASAPVKTVSSPIKAEPKVETISSSSAPIASSSSSLSLVDTSLVPASSAGASASAGAISTADGSAASAQAQAYATTSDSGWLLASRKAWLDLHLGLLYSQWQKLSGGFNKGSLVAGFSVSQTVLPSLEAGLGINFIRGTNSNGATNDIRSGYEVTGSARFGLMDAAVTPFASVRLSLGQYRAWDAISEVGNNVTYKKNAGGTLAGVAPGLGASTVLFGDMRLGLTVEYAIYFGKSAKHVGGLDAIANVGFLF